LRIIFGGGGGGCVSKFSILPCSLGKAPGQVSQSQLERETKLPEAGPLSGQEDVAAVTLGCLLLRSQKSGRL